MTSTVRRRSPLWVLTATAAGGVLVGVGVLATLGAAGDRAATGPAPADAITLQSVERQPLSPTTKATMPETTMEIAPETTRATTPETTMEIAPEPTRATTPTSVSAPTPAPAPSPAPAPAPAQPVEDGTISREEAGAIAAAHVNGVVDSIDRESDYGAAWDVDVHAPDGEYTIYVSATGVIVRVVGPY